MQQLKTIMPPSNTMNMVGIGIKTVTSGSDPERVPETLEQTKKRLEQEAAAFNNAVIEPKDGIFCNLCGNKQSVARVIPQMSKRSDGTEYVRNWYVQDELCACVQKRNEAIKLKKSGMKDAIENVGQFVATEDWQKVILQKARGFVAQTQATCFFIGGSSGSGKTHISTLICRTLMERGHSLIYRKWLEAMRELTDYRNEQRGELFKELTDIEVLYLDDVFKPSGAPPNPHEVRATFEIIDRRYISPKKITLISSELTIDQIERVDYATARRIEEMAGNSEFVTNIGKDRIFTRVDYRHGR